MCFSSNQSTRPPSLFLVAFVLLLCWGLVETWISFPVICIGFSSVFSLDCFQLGFTLRDYFLHPWAARRELEKLITVVYTSVIQTLQESNHFVLFHFTILK